MGRSQGNLVVSDEAVHAVFTLFDKDDSRTMTFQEWKNYWDYALGGDANPNTLMETNFALHLYYYLADTDSSGVWSENEFETLIKKLAQKKENESVEDLWTKEELNKALFHITDEDNNGSASIEELNNHMI